MAGPARHIRTCRMEEAIQECMRTRRRHEAIQRCIRTRRKREAIQDRNGRITLRPINGIRAILSNRAVTC